MSSQRSARSSLRRENKYTARAAARRHAIGASDSTNSENSLGKRYCFAVFGPRSGPGTPTAGSSSRTRSASIFDEAASALIFVAVPHTFDAVFHLMSLAWTHAAAVVSIGEYIDGFYNPARRHSHLDYVSPIEFEMRSHLAAVAA